jgi:polar amino acid transport system substrate-binding protein
MNLPPDLRHAAPALAPTGRLRVVINLGNPMLSRRSSSGDLAGISVDMAQSLSELLKVPLELQSVDAAAKSVALVRAEQADVGFFALDPARSEGLNFTKAYVHIEGAYLVREQSPLTSNEDVDRSGIRVAVGKGSAYDLFLTRHLKQASIIRTDTGALVMPEFEKQTLEVAAGIRQPLEAFCKPGSGYRMLPGRFMVIEQAMGLPGSRSATAIGALRQFVEFRKSSGAVAQSIKAHGIIGALVAPAG